MDFIGNLLNQMSSAFNQETAIPKKEEISMDETLKWRALKNNTFASRTRGTAAAASGVAAVPGAGGPEPSGGGAIPPRPSSALVVGRVVKSGIKGATANGGGGGQGRQHSESSNDGSLLDADGGGGLLELEDGSSGGSNSSALLAANGGGPVRDDPDDPEDGEDIEIEIAKDISGEELQEALGLSQLIDVQEPMDEEGVVGQPPKAAAALVAVQKHEPNGSEGSKASRDEKETSEGDRKDSAQRSTDDSTSSNEGDKKDKMGEKMANTRGVHAERPLVSDPSARGANDREGVREDRDEKVHTPQGRATSGAASVGSTDRQRSESVRKTANEDATEGSILEEVTLDGLGMDDEDDDDDDDVLIISTGDMTDVVEVAETSKEEDEDDDEEDGNDGQKEEVHDREKAVQKSVVREETCPAKEVKGQEGDVLPVACTPSVESSAASDAEAEEKYRPEDGPQTVGGNVVKAGEEGDEQKEQQLEESKFSPSLVPAVETEKMKDGADSQTPVPVANGEPEMTTSLSSSIAGQKTHARPAEGNSEGKSVGGVSETKPDEPEDHVARSAAAGGRTTRSKKAATAFAATVVASSSSSVVAAGDNTSMPSASTPSQRRSQRFQLAKEPPATGGRKSAPDAKTLNGGSIGESEVASAGGGGAIVVVKEEQEPDEAMAKKKAVTGASAAVKGSAKASGAATSDRSVAGVERSSSVNRSDRSLRSRQQSTSSGSGVGVGNSSGVATRRASETVKSLTVEDSNESVDMGPADRLPLVNRRGRKRLSQDPLETAREKVGANRVPTPAKEEKEEVEQQEQQETKVAVGGAEDFPLDPGENDSGGGERKQPAEEPVLLVLDQKEEKDQKEQKEEPQERKEQPPQPAAPAPQRRGRKRKTQNPPEAGGGAGSSGSPEKPPPYKRAARVSRDGSDGILASALARRDKVDPQGRLSRPIKLSAKMLANEELRHGFEQHNNSRIIIGSDSSLSAAVQHQQQQPSAHDEPTAVALVEREKDRDRTTAIGQQQQQQDGGASSEKLAKKQQQQECKEVNLPPPNSAISSSSEDVMVVSVTYPAGKGPAGASGKGLQSSLVRTAKDTAPSTGRKPTESSSDRQRSSTKPTSGNAGPAAAAAAKRAAGPVCPDVQTFLQEIRASRIGIGKRSPEDNRKLNRRQTKRMAKLKEKHLLALGLLRKGAIPAHTPATVTVRNGTVVVARPRKSSVDEQDDDALLLSEPEPESESSGSEADFVPRQKIGTVGKPSVTLRLRKPETLLESPAPVVSSSAKQKQKQQQQHQQPPLVTVPSAMVNRGSAVGASRQPAKQQHPAAGNSSRQQAGSSNGRTTSSTNVANPRRSSAAPPVVVLPASMTTVTASSLRKDQETEQLQRSLERFGCELTLIPNTTTTTTTSTPASSDGRSSVSSASQAANRKQRAKEQQRTPVRPNHHHHAAHRPQGSPASSISSSSSSVLATTSPSLQIVLEKRQSPAEQRAAGGGKTSSMGSPPVPAGDRPLLCLCRQTSDIFVASSAGTGYCTAVDDIDGQRIGCCNELSDHLVHMLRPSSTVSFQLLCNLHRKRLEDHSCCAVCGVFCTQGNFAMCKNAHIFHPDCAPKYILNAPYDPARAGDHPAPTLVLQCPHCAQECPNGEIQVTVQLTTPPVLLPSRKNIVKPAKMAIAKSKTGSTNGGSSTAKDAFRANVDAIVPSSVRSMLAAGGSSNGHEPNARGGRSPAVAGGSGSGTTRNHFSTKQIFEAIHKDDVDRITEIIMSGFDIETRFRDFHDGTCLHLVSNFGSIGMAYLIICRAQSVDFLNILDRELRTALMCAVLGAKIDIIKLLLECGADVTVKGPDGMTVLHLAAKLGQHEAVRMILEWARKRLTARDLLAFVNGVDDGPYTALVWAAENRHKDTIQLLLGAGADVNICDKENNTSLHWAAMAGCSDSMHLLLKKGCDPNVQNINGDTPLHLACRHGNGDICIMLLTMGASLNVRNESDELPQDMLRNPNSECASIIAANVKMFSLGKNTKETRILCSDISNGREYYPVQVVHVAGRNERQQTVPKFKYIKKSVQIECRIDTNMCDMTVCLCKDSCTSSSADSSCLCSERTWYTDDGRLVNDFNFLEPPTIVECGDLCECNQLLCRNRVVQRGLRVPLQLFYNPGKAWSVRTLVPIPKGTFLVEYVGELLTDEVAHQRPDDTYFFDLNSGFCIDANAHGNVSRFFNHSCDPNVSPVSVYYEHQDKRFPKVAMFACRDIKAQEEICFNYGEKFWMVKNRTMSCLCNTSECRYRTVQHEVALV